MDINMMLTVDYQNSESSQDSRRAYNPYDASDSDDGKTGGKTDGKVNGKTK